MLTLADYYLLDCWIQQSQWQFRKIVLKQLLDDIFSLLFFRHVIFFPISLVLVRLHMASCIFIKKIQGAP